MRGAVRTDAGIGRASLPEELDSFVGRQNEVAEVRRLLSESRLVTLTGPGGVGKTRLALRVARESRKVFTGGTWFVELGDLRDPDLLWQTVTDVLGLQDWSARPPEAVLVEHLADGRALLILDNCEHLVDAVANFSDTLLRACPGLSMLATSREPLGIGGEAVVRVPPLTVAAGTGPGEQMSDAVLLFEERARAAVPDFRVTDDNRAVVEEICARLEGLPLPIELAAARLRALSVEQIRDRLSDRFRLLTLGGRTSPGRQQTLRMSIDWSYDLCTDAERRLWACLSVFAGGFDLDTAESVLHDEAGPVDVLDVVTALVDKSILVRDEADSTGVLARYRMLETIREYGQEKLEEFGWTDIVRRRHLDWFERFVLRAKNDWIGPRQVQWAAAVDVEQSNIREAIEFALAERDWGAALRITAALYPAWIVRGRFNEGRLWLRRSWEGDGGPIDDRIEALCVNSMLAALQQDIVAATVLADKARRLAEEGVDDVSAARAAAAVAYAAVTRGDLEPAQADLGRAIAVFRERDDLYDLVPALYWQGYVIDILGDPDEASAHYDEALAVTEAHGEIMWRAMIMSDYGSSLWRHGQLERGSAMLVEALPLLRALDNQFGGAWCFEQLAWTVVEQDPERAAVFLGAAEVLFTATGSPIETFQPLVAYHEQCVRRAREALGDNAFDAARQRGVAMNTEEVIAYALGEQPLDVAEPAADSGHNLTRREMQVAELVAEGMTNRAIAERLVIAPRTVEGHVDHILAKLGFTSRTQVAAWMVAQRGGAR
ncbi:ATP-binding protein [Prescottella equi]|uniref:ATP-binding protein n=1 Tax=Rhodococcus hoagii TaxID=43767 RepID=UPI0021B3B7C0|nr:LuxR C-terminal-related transcriptional regulator [Prescottella equi]